MDSKLDTQLKDPYVIEQLQRKGWMGSGQKIKRQKYCELLCTMIPEALCPTVPECEVKADDLPPPKRQCTMQVLSEHRCYGLTTQ
jgi:hypothetical protein